MPVFAATAITVRFAMLMAIGSYVIVWVARLVVTVMTVLPVMLSTTEDIDVMASDAPRVITIAPPAWKISMSLVTVLDTAAIVPLAS